MCQERIFVVGIEKNFTFLLFLLYVLWCLLHFSCCMLPLRIYMYFQGSLRRTLTRRAARFSRLHDYSGHGQLASSRRQQMVRTGLTN